MVRRLLLSWISATLVVISLAWGVWYWMSRPTVNVLLITLDTTRADHIGCYGYQPALTPTLDKLAAQGVLFEHAYTVAPLTLPSHASMMTGLYPAEHGLRSNGRGSLSPSIPTLATTLVAAGYDTAGFVAAFVLNAKFGLQRGFSVYGDDLPRGNPTHDAIEQQRDAKLVVDSALAWLKTPRRRPFFCWVHLFDPHKPYQARSAEFGDRFEKLPYDGEIAYVDQQVARLIAYLDANHLRENTLIVVVGDHGEGLGDHEERGHGSTLYNSALRVPWIWSGRGISAPGSRVAQPVSLVDLAPTLLESLEVRVPANISGRSLRSALVGQPIESRPCFAATDDPLLEHGCAPLRGIIAGKWKYVRSPEVELYHLSNDPQELKNLATTHQERIGPLEELLMAHEGSLTERGTAKVQLTAQERKGLASLGYLGGSASPKGLPPTDVLSDIKRRLPFFNRVEDAQTVLEQGDAAAAAQQLRKIISQVPNYILARTVLADALAAQGKFDEAQKELEAVLQLDPEQSDARFRIGGMLIAQSREDEAIAQFEQTLHTPPNAEELVYLGQVLVQFGQNDRAESYFKQAIAIDPHFVAGQIALGHLYASQQRTKTAIDHYRAALRDNPVALEAHLNLAVMLAREQRSDDALRHLAKAVQIAPANADVRYNYGTLLLGAGRLTEAIRELEAALRLDPTHSHAAARLQQARAALGA